MRGGRLEVQRWVFYRFIRVLELLCEICVCLFVLAERIVDFVERELDGIGEKPCGYRSTRFMNSERGAIIINQYSHY